MGPGCVRCLEWSYNGFVRIPHEGPILEGIQDLGAGIARFAMVSEKFGASCRRASRPQKEHPRSRSLHRCQPSIVGLPSGQTSSCSTWHAAAGSEAKKSAETDGRPALLPSITQNNLFQIVAKNDRFSIFDRFSNSLVCVVYSTFHPAKNPGASRRAHKN